MVDAGRGRWNAGKGSVWAPTASRRTLRRRVGASVDDALVDRVHHLRDARRLAREELEAPHALGPGAPRLALGRLDDGRRVGVHLHARHVVPCQEAGAGLVGAEVEQLVRAGGRAPLVSAERREVESLRAHLLVPREGAGLRAVSKRWLGSRGTDARKEERGWHRCEGRACYGGDVGCLGIRR